MVGLTLGPVLSTVRLEHELVVANSVSSLGHKLLRGILLCAGLQAKTCWEQVENDICWAPEPGACRRRAGDMCLRVCT